MTYDDFVQILADVRYRDWEFYIGLDGDRLYLQVYFMAIHADGGGYDMQTGRKWMLSPHMTRSEVVQTALKAVLTAEEHEARERFKYRGKAIFGPHLDVDVLHDVSNLVDIRQAV